jgi:hypothetical protein
MELPWKICIWGLGDDLKCSALFDPDKAEIIAWCMPNVEKVTFGKVNSIRLNEIEV